MSRLRPPSPKPRAVTVALLVGLAALAGSVAALAYLTTAGAGTGSATVRVLNPATGATATATPGSGTVGVSWTASVTGSSLVTPQGYYVTHTQGVTTSPACGTSPASLITSTSCSDTGVADGTYTYTVVAVYRTWSAASAPSNAVTVVNDNTPPTVSSIVRHTGSPTNATTVQFDVAFSESVTGVDANDFALATAGVTGASITTVAGGGSSFSVTVNTGSGSGTVGLNLVDNDTIHDLAGNPLGGTGAGNGSFIGQVYTIDKTLPTVVSIAIRDASPTKAATLNWTVTFSEPVSGLAASNFVTARSGITGTPVVGTPTANGGPAPQATWNVPVTTSGVTGTNVATIGLNMQNVTAIVDTAGNGVSASLPVVGGTYNFDTTAPTVLSVNRVGATSTNQTSVNWTVTFSESVTGVDSSDFTLVRTGAVSGGGVSGVSGSGAVYTVTATTGTGDGTLGLNVLNDGTIKDAATNPLSAAFTGQTYTIDKTAPVLQSLQMFDQNADGKVDHVQATFNETLAASTSVAPWTLTNVPSGGTLSSVSVAGAVVTLTITAGAGAADTSVGAFTIALAQSATGIQDALGNQSSFAATAPVDKAGPVPVSLVDSNGLNDGKFEAGDSVIVTFSEPITGVSASSTVSLISGNGSNDDSVTMTNFLAGVSSVTLNRGDYISGNNNTAIFVSTLTQPLSNQIRLVLGTCTGACANITTAAGVGSFTFTPVTTVTDAAGNAAVGSITVSIKLF